MDINCEWLEKHFFKEHLSEKQKALVCKKFEAVLYQMGDVIIQQGQESHTVYIINYGSVSIDNEQNGEHINIGIAKTGDLIGEMSFISKETASATVTAKEPCLVYKLSRKAFMDMKKEDKGLVNLTFLTLLKRAADIVRHMNTEKASVQQYMSGSHC